jgi:hypothetical protein
MKDGFWNGMFYLIAFWVTAYVVFRPGGPVDDIHKYFDQHFAEIQQKQDLNSQKLDGIIERLDYLKLLELQYQPNGR